jgi:PAS domain S-box-containing protein
MRGMLLCLVGNPWFVSPPRTTGSGNFDMPTMFTLKQSPLSAFTESQQPLLKARTLQEAIFNSANFSCIATDAQGVIQIFNVGAERMLGYKAQDVVDKITPAGISDAQEVIARAAALSLELDTQITPGFEALVFKASRGIEDVYELTYIRKDGSRFPAIVSVTALRDAQEKVIGYLLIGTDNTARKQVEAEQALLDQRLREHQHRLEETNIELEKSRAAAQKANLAKSEFLSSMSHELRTPLNAVLGFAQLMESATPLPTPAQKLSIEQILKGGWYLLHLINEILDLASIESGKVTMSHEAMSLTEVLQDCQVMIEPQATSHGIHITFSPFDNLFYVHADRTRVKQVMINLLSNAIKYNRANGVVVVQCGMVGGNRVRVSVSDTGVGLAPEQLAQLFQPFNRLGQANGVEEGTGIGLVVTKQLTELMGGSVGVESSVGVGSVFWIELPASSAPQQVFGSGVEGVPTEGNLGRTCTSTAPRTLLYVEDNPANLALVEQLIARRSDLKLLTAIDAHLGIELARTHQPEVILMDINLPGMSGVEALKRLRKDSATAHIPVMALTANVIPHEIKKGLDAGFFRYLTKPIKFNEFMDSLDVALKYAAENGRQAPQKQQL